MRRAARGGGAGLRKSVGGDRNRKSRKTSCHDDPVGSVCGRINKTTTPLVSHPVPASVSNNIHRASLMLLLPHPLSLLFKLFELGRPQKDICLVERSPSAVQNASDTSGSGGCEKKVKQKKTKKNKYIHIPNKPLSPGEMRGGGGEPAGGGW